MVGGLLTGDWVVHEEGIGGAELARGGRQRLGKEDERWCMGLAWLRDNLGDWAKV